MAKSNPKYEEKCGLQGDKHVIDEVKYTVDNLADLPEELSACRTAEKSNEDTLVFHGKYSSFSNFHHSTFQIIGKKYPTAEHYIQYQKLLLFGHSVKANKILRSTTPLEAKKLSYDISDYSRSKWIHEGYEKCARGIREKFVQNNSLLESLKSTYPKTLAEARIDKLWATGIPLRDKDALVKSNWESPGWLSKILTKIRDDI